MAIKRLREAIDDQEEIMEDTRTANLLLFLSGTEVPTTKQPSSHIGFDFECKTCHRSFKSFQALGGHCTSHNRESKRSRMSIKLFDVSMKANKMHKCSKCGMKFEMGQALGGHMRRHRMNAVKDHEKRGCMIARTESWLDLNLGGIWSTA